MRAHSNNWLPREGEYEPLEENRLGRDHEDMVDELVDLGFVVLGHWRVPDHANATGVMTLLEHPQTLDVASVIVTKGRNRSGRTYTLAFQTRFEDCTEISTANSPKTVGLPRQARITGLWLPEVRDPRELHRVHEQVRNRLGVGKRRLSVGPDCLAFLLDSRRQTIDEWVKEGYYYLDQAEGVCRPTWKGAVLTTWRLIWPIRPLFRARRRRATHRLLRELGVQVPRSDTRNDSDS
jgi:hypothetical protein